MTKAVFGLATNEEQARRIVDCLLSSEFSNEDISILYPDRSKGKIRTNERKDVEYDDTFTPSNVKKGNITTEKRSKAPEGGVTGATAGGILGGSLGLLAGIGALAIPGLGPFIAAGPIMAALSGSAVGGGVGLLIGALIGSGIPEYEAKKYEEGLRQGNILISVHTDSSEEVDRASEIMKKEGAKDISSTREKAKSSY
jgi:outer membrane lipoprotein SlyB